MVPPEDELPRLAQMLQDAPDARTVEVGTPDLPWGPGNHLLSGQHLLGHQTLDRRLADVVNGPPA